MNNIKQVIDFFEEEVRSYAECCSLGASGLYEDMNAEDAEYIYNRRHIIQQARIELENKGC